MIISIGTEVDKACSHSVTLKLRIKLWKCIATKSNKTERCNRCEVELFIMHTVESHPFIHPLTAVKEPHAHRSCVLFLCRTASLFQQTALVWVPQQCPILQRFLFYCPTYHLHVILILILHFPSALLFPSIVSVSPQNVFKVCTLLWS